MQVSHGPHKPNGRVDSGLALEVVGHLHCSICHGPITATFRPDGSMTASHRYDDDGFPGDHSPDPYVRLPSTVAGFLPTSTADPSARHSAWRNAQREATDRIPASELRPGDLVHTGKGWVRVEHAVEALFPGEHVWIQRHDDNQPGPEPDAAPSSDR